MEERSNLREQNVRGGAGWSRGDRRWHLVALLRSSVSGSLRQTRTEVLQLIRGCEHATEDDAFLNGSHA